MNLRDRGPASRSMAIQVWRETRLATPLYWLVAFCGAVVFCWALKVHAQSSEISLPVPANKVLLVVAGAIERSNVGDEAHFDRAMIEQFQSHIVFTSTSVTDGVSRFEGPLMRDVLQYVGAKGLSVRAHALNDYVVDIPLSDFYEHDVLLALYMDGKRLESTDKGPIWIIYPRESSRRLQDIRYDYRWVWQLNHLTVK